MFIKQPQQAISLQRRSTKFKHQTRPQNIPLSTCTPQSRIQCHTSRAPWPINISNPNIFTHILQFHSTPIGRPTQPNPTPPPPYQNQSINWPICTLINIMIDSFWCKQEKFPWRHQYRSLGGGRFYRGRNVWFEWWRRFQEGWIWRWRLHSFLRGCKMGLGWGLWHSLCRGGEIVCRSSEHFKWGRRYRRIGLWLAVVVVAIPLLHHRPIVS
jgi:hypothetical protein